MLDNQTYTVMKVLLIISFTLIVAALIYYFKSVSYPVKTRIYDSWVEFRVDSKLAAAMLENNCKYQPLIKLRQAYNDKPLTTKTLQEIGDKYSTDVSTLYFMERLYKDPKQKSIHREFNKISSTINWQRINHEMDQLRSFYYVFVPGLGYKTQPHTGAGFDKQRKILEELKIPFAFIETGEIRPVEENAALIASKIRKISREHDNIILVSASKGGLEVAQCFGKFLKPEEMKSIKAWISVSGIIRGCRLSDTYNTFPMNIIKKYVLKQRKIDDKVLEDLEFRTRNKEFENFKFPEHLVILHYLGAPLQSTVTPNVKERFRALKKFGANDGSAPITEQLSRQGLVIAELGLDHYMIDPKINEKTFVLIELAIKEINKRLRVKPATTQRD